MPRFILIVLCGLIFQCAQAESSDTSTSPKIGFCWNVEFSAGFMQFGITPSFGVATKHFGNFSLGSGVQILNQYPGDYVIRSMFTNRFNVVHPVYFQYDYRFTKKRVSPAFQLQSGYVMPQIFKQDVYTNTTIGYDKYQGGAYLSAAAGLSFKLSKSSKTFIRLMFDVKSYSMFARAYRSTWFTNPDGSYTFYFTGSFLKQSIIPSLTFIISGSKW